MARLPFLQISTVCLASELAILLTATSLLCCSFFDRFKTQKKVLDDDTLTALGYGLNFSYTKKVDPIEIAKSIDSFEHFSGGRNDIIRGMIYASIPDRPDYSVPRRMTTALSNLKKDDTIHVTKGDKSNQIVIMDREEYNTKMMTILADTSTYKARRADTTEVDRTSFNNAVRKIIKNKDVSSTLTVTNPTCSYMYGTVKTHKVGTPLRPIISTIGSFSYKVAKYLTKVLQPISNTISGYMIKNTGELIQRLKNLNVGYNFKLVSFDVKNLFTSIPTDILLDYLNTFPDGTFSLNTCDVVALVKLCIDSTTFSFGGRYYQQTGGLPMGSCLSPLLANIFMEYFETQL